MRREVRQCITVDKDSGPIDRMGRGALAPPLSQSSIATRHVTDYAWAVIKTFADRHTRELYVTGKSRRFPPDVLKRATRKLE